MVIKISLMTPPRLSETVSSPWSSNSTFSEGQRWLRSPIFMANLHSTIFHYIMDYVMHLNEIGSVLLQNSACWQLTLEWYSAFLRQPCYANYKLMILYHTQELHFSFQQLVILNSKAAIVVKATLPEILMTTPLHISRVNNSLHSKFSSEPRAGLFSSSRAQNISSASDISFSKLLNDRPSSWLKRKK